MALRHDVRERDPCTSGAGCGLPPGFFRLRYFHGKQMRLADYVDEQRYHASKLRFHNDRLHGAGILCGLKVSLLDEGGVVLRVGRGAALDDCGREVIVGFDQCVDVDAWYRRERHKQPDAKPEDPCHPDAENKVRVCVAIRYSECAQSPEPAPAAACQSASSCDCDGCSSCQSRSCDPCAEGADFGRVAEEFELRLMFHEEAHRLTGHRLFPDEAAIQEAVVRASGGTSLLKELARPIRVRCPASQEEWLLLACFDAIIAEGETPKVQEIRDIDYDCAAQVLLSTEVIQYLLGSLYAEVDPGIGGPEVVDVAFQKVGEGRYQFVLSLSDAIDPASLDKDDASFNLRQLTSGGWEAPGSNVVSAVYGDAQGGQFSVDGPAIYVTIENKSGFLADGGRYHLFSPRASDPVVDGALRHLRPRDFEWRFGLTVDPDSGDLVMGGVA